MTLLKRLALALAFVGAAPGVLAAPLAYDEAVSGDLDVSPVTPLALDIGVNTVKGSVFASPGIDFDSFLFDLPSGGQVVSISLAFQLANRGAANPAVGYDLGAAHQDVSFLGASPVDLFPAELPLTSSQFLISNSIIFCGCAGTGWSADYILTVTVRPEAIAEVPEPGSLALLAAGCGAFLLARQRRVKSGTA
jgi:hypothetical protein